MTGIFECTRHFSMKRVSWEDVGFVIETNNTFLTEKLYDFVLEKVKTVAKVDDECHYLEDIVMDVLTHIINLYRSGAVQTKFSQVLPRLCLGYTKKYVKEGVYTDLGNFVVVYSFDDTLCKEDFALYTRDLLKLLNQRCRDVVKLYYYDEHSISEIADIMGISYSKAYGLLETSRKILIPKLYKDFSQGEIPMPDELAWDYILG